MKRCPKCNRTYADDAFTFCLEDGALLSAPYDSEKKEEPISTIQSGGPPPTAVLPSSRFDSAPDAQKSSAILSAPTIASPGEHPSKKDTTELFAQPNDASRKTSKLPYVGIGLLVLLIVGGLSLYLIGQSRCPNMDVTVRCSPSSSNSTGCLLSINGAPAYAIGQQAGAKNIPDTNWTVSSGKVTMYSYYSASIDTTGLAGREITVTANVTTGQWFCAKTASTSYVVPQTPASSK